MVCLPKKENGNCGKMMYEAVGTEVLPQQLKHYTEEVHSYQIESLGLLSRLMHQRTVVKTGKELSNGTKIRNR